MKYLVHLRPSSALAEKIEQFRRHLAQFVLEEVSNVPHCTLMAARFREEDEAKICAALEKIVLPPFDLEMGALDIFEERTGSCALVVRLVASDVMNKLHLRVIDALRPHINWPEVPTYDFSLFDNPAQREAVYRRSGSPFYAQFYTPHISIATVTSAQKDTGILERPIFVGDSWQVDAVYLSKKAPEWQTVSRFALRAP